ncbi:MAG: hypothetical protein CBC01_01415 [Betaproteobacteria bacterium TMED41]|nr:MAG: hypothetical protein CBC01_01415 [Betaproteobacteria bacterium TMED41]
MLYHGLVSRLINVLLLAAGEGTRLRPITENTPKCLVKIGGRPLLEYWLDILNDSSIVDKIYINVCYLSEQVIDYVKKHKLCSKIILIKEETLIGTGGTLINLLKKLQDQKPIFFAHADNFTKFKIKEFYQAHLERPDECGITMMTFITDAPESCGIVTVNEDGVVTDFNEKVSGNFGNLANGAIFLIDPKYQVQIRNLKNIKDFSAEVIPMFLNKIYTYKNEFFLLDIGTPDRLLKARELINLKNIQQ